MPQFTQILGQARIPERTHAAVCLGKPQVSAFILGSRQEAPSKRGRLNSAKIGVKRKKRPELCQLARYSMRRTEPQLRDSSPTGL